MGSFFLSLRAVARRGVVIDFWGKFLVMLAYVYAGWVLSYVYAGWVFTKMSVLMSQFSLLFMATFAV